MRYLKSILVLACFLNICEADPFKYRLNPYRAEQILSGLQFRPRLIGEEWIRVLGSRKDEKFAVKRGDTLWDISERSFNNARLWPKLWAVNPKLSNPHKLDIGDLLQYYTELSEEYKYLSSIPVIKLVPNKDGAMSDLSDNSFINIKVSNRYRPNLFLLDKAKDNVFGKVSGAYTQRRNFIEGDLIYLKFDDPDAIEEGDTFSIIRKERDVETEIIKGGDTVVSTVVRLLGEVKVYYADEGLVRAVVTSVSGQLQRGDWITEIIPATALITADEPPSGLQMTVLMGETPNLKQLIQGHLVLLDKGEERGVETGQIYRVYRDTDPFTKSTLSVDPDFKGEVQIVSTSKNSSVGIISKNEEPVYPGDTLYPYHIFPERPVESIRQIVTIDLEQELSEIKRQTEGK